MTGEPAPEQVVREALRRLPAEMLAQSSPTVSEALAALDALVAQRDEALRDVTWTLDYEGRKPMDTVKLLGDREAVLAVQKLKADKEAAQARVAELLNLRQLDFAEFKDCQARVAALTDALREIAAIYKWFAADRYTDAGLRVGRVLTIAREALAAAGEPEAATP